MRALPTLTAAAFLAASTSLALAQSEQDHAAHHPVAASSAKKSPAQAKAARAKASASSASAGMGMGMGGEDMQKMHDEMHKPDGMHDRMHGKDGKTMDGMSAASEASK